jgi:Concanavalin A-like lectin/glucanases superfamily
VAGATTSRLTLTAVQPGQAGTYSVTVSNLLAVESSQPAVLIVNTNPVLLVGLWRFNEGSGTNIADSSGFKNDGVLGGENGNIPAWVSGQAGFGGALRFTNDGLNHAYVTIPGSTSLQIGSTTTNPWTITAWAYEDSNGTADFVAAYGRIMVLDDGTAFQWESGASGDPEMYTWSRASTAWQLGWGAFPQVAPVLDQWVHWAVVYDGTNLTVYRNGNQGPQGGVASSPVTASLAYAGYAGAVNLGSELGQGPSRNWNGMLDDVAVFNTALSEAQVNTVMSGDFTSFITRPPLFIGLRQGQVVLSWTAMLPGYHLQSSPSLASPQWADVVAGVVQQGPLLTVNQPVSSGARFFRLHLN